MRPWWERFLKVVVMGATMCSGIIVPISGGPLGMRGTKESGGLSRPNRT